MTEEIEDRLEQPCPFCRSRFGLSILDDEHGPAIYCAHCDWVFEYPVMDVTVDELIDRWNSKKWNMPQEFDEGEAMKIYERMVGRIHALIGDFMQFRKYGGGPDYLFTLNVPPLDMKYRVVIEEVIDEREISISLPDDPGKDKEGKE